MSERVETPEIERSEQAKVEGWRLHVLMEAGYPLPLAERLAGSDADLHRIDAHRLGDVLELRFAEVADRQIEPRPYLPIGVLGKTDTAWISNAFKPRCNVDASPIRSPPLSSTTSPTWMPTRNSWSVRATRS